MLEWLRCHIAHAVCTGNDVRGGNEGCGEEMTLWGNSKVGNVIG